MSLKVISMKAALCVAFFVGGVVMANAEGGPARGLHSAAAILVAQTFQFRARFGGKGVTAPGKADRLGYCDFLELGFHHRQFGFQSSRGLGCRKACVGPGMVADLKSHAMDLGNFLPIHEVGGVRHPAMRNKERGAESQFLQQWCDQCSMRLDGVVERQDHNFVARSFLCIGGSVAILSRCRAPSEKTQDEQETQEAVVSNVLQKDCRH